jgi:uncharacterized protein YneF (UPF0154 family)
MDWAVVIVVVVAFLAGGLVGMWWTVAWLKRKLRGAVDAGILTDDDLRRLDRYFRVD